MNATIYDQPEHATESHLLLNLDELNQRHVSTKQHRQKVFDDILRSCHHKIRKYNKEFKKQECLYAPPVFILGKPPYNYVDLINYLRRSLHNNGLKAEWLADRKSLYVSWRPVDVDMAQYQSQFTDTTYNDDPDNQLQIMKVGTNSQLSTSSSASSTKKKKKDAEKPHIQHVAMIHYNNHAQDVIPINIKGLKTTHGGLRP